MKRTAYYLWLIPDHRTGQFRKSRFRASEPPMTGAIRLDETIEWRDVPEPSDPPTSNQWPLVLPGGRATISALLDTADIAQLLEQDEGCKGSQHEQR